MRRHLWWCSREDALYMRVCARSARKGLAKDQVRRARADNLCPPAINLFFKARLLANV
jgi:hypothetical protein